MNIFITGVSRGLGKELALHFIKNNHKVFGLSRSDISDEKLMTSGNFSYFKGTVNNEGDINLAYEKALEFLGNIDVLINNAAYKIFKIPVELSSEEYKEAVQTNLISPILICSKFISHFIANKKGYIINISSNAGMTAYSEGTAYCSSKAGLIAY